ncbi:DUF5827 family protein [Halorarum halobium]|uniref:DUF5827 family protein n=1 Tax=Halorarum halobium TaxID=3075121 RepID=UPI0028B1D8C4|nr:DUF5827 family protein [Halobaculum sp. XH14]
MPIPKTEFPALHPCDFYTPEELLDPERMYTVYEIARLLQGLDPDATIDEGTEEILLDWTIPWIMRNAAELVVAEPRTDDEPGYYGLKEPGDLDRESDEDADGPPARGE